MQKYIISVLLIIISLSLSGLSCTLFSAKNSSLPKVQQISTGQNSNELLTGMSPDQINSQASANYNKAQEQALTWQPDAVLYAFIIKIPSSLKNNQAMETYVFGSPADSKVWYTISINQQSGKVTRAWVLREDYMPQIKNPIKIQYWKTNYLEAFQTADKKDGKIFREKNPTASVTLTLAITEPKNWLWWTVEYQVPFSGETLQVRIDPNTGKIVNDNGEPVGDNK